MIFWSAKKRCNDTFFHRPSPFPGIFCNCNSGGICAASQFYVQLLLLYSVRSNAYSEIGPEVTLRPLVTSCAKDYKGHSVVQTSFAEPPNFSLCVSLFLPRRYSPRHLVLFQQIKLLSTVTTALQLSMAGSVSLSSFSLVHILLTTQALPTCVSFDRV